MRQYIEEADIGLQILVIASAHNRPLKRGIEVYGSVNFWGGFASGLLAAAIGSWLF